jgi:hypothetical protein
MIGNCDIEPITGSNDTKNELNEFSIEAVGPSESMPSWLSWKGEPIFKALDFELEAVVPFE